MYCTNKNEGMVLVSILNSTHELWCLNSTEEPGVLPDRGVSVPASRSFVGHKNIRHSVGAVIPNNSNQGHPNVLMSGSEESEVFFV